MPRFGGKGGLRQACVQRMCEVLTEEQRLHHEVVLEQRATERTERDQIRANEPRTAGAARWVGMSSGWGEHDELPAGTLVEVRMVEDGLAGAVYTGAVVGAADTSLENMVTTSSGPGAVDEQERLCVEYEELLTGEDCDGGQLRENVSKADMRLRPPHTPRGFTRLLRPGDGLELFHEDGWWNVKLEAALPGDRPGSFRVSSTEYEQTHTVTAKSLRPPWRWWAGSSEAQPCWRFEIDQGDGRVSSSGTDPTFSFAPGVKRGHDIAQPDAQSGNTFLDRVWEQLEGATEGATASL